MKPFNELIGRQARVAMKDDARLRQLISRIVPPAALPHVRFLRLEGHELHVTLSASAWVSRLRFFERQILGETSKAGLQATRMRWHVDPKPIPVAARTRPSRRIQRSSNAARLVDSTADGMEPSPLKEAMKRMAAMLADGEQRK